VKNKAIILIVIVIVAIVGILLGAQLTGLIDIKPVFADLPFVGKYFGESEKEQLYIAPLEDENSLLKERIALLEQEISQKEILTVEETEATNVKIAELESEVKRLTEELENLKDLDSKATELANYYGNMKPDEAVRIFENLDDETVIMILRKMQTDTVGKVLAAMEPIRAAKITRVLTDIERGEAE